jgi:uncharacterized protein
VSSIPYATLTSIKSLSWSLALDSSVGGAPGAGIGQIVQAIEDIHQSLKILFGTIPGEDPFRPTFGVDLTQFLDKPVTIITPVVVSVVKKAIALWEPRIILVSVTPSYSQDEPSQLSVSLIWKPNLSSDQLAGTQTTTILVGGVSFQS